MTCERPCQDLVGHVDKASSSSTPGAVKVSTPAPPSGKPPNAADTNPVGGCVASESLVDVLRPLRMVDHALSKTESLMSMPNQGGQQWLGQGADILPMSAVHLWPCLYKVPIHCI